MEVETASKDDISADKGSQSPQSSQRENPAPLREASSSTHLATTSQDFEPGFWKPLKPRKFADPAPLGLCAFALTTFVLSLMNIHVLGAHKNSLVIGLAFGYGGIVQLLAGMWEIFIGNTFAATAFSSYGGFWLAYAIINMPGGFGISEVYTNHNDGAIEFNLAVGYFLAGWFIFTTLLLICTYRTTLAFLALFLNIDIVFLLLTIAHFLSHPDGSLPHAWIASSGYFGLAAAFLAWYNALAAIVDDRFVASLFSVLLRYLAIPKILGLPLQQITLLT
ncbi:Bgt-4312 [Blumeria graminis f. sp. tritici]|uniref:Acetate transporter n=3 Tax=Blumeria graminis f. sp. tritici TaxID=62690 RepID=A0A656KJF7_BLUGR|nr:Acetate transporter [Blumeria graminis f. sp. tritici 96224]VDB83945.1 Bgt-4312 [Blumeria graminis f. sp. tritici]